MRDAVINELVKVAERDNRVQLLTGDLGYKVLDNYIISHSKQFINVGIAEQNMTSVAAGLALEGNVVFTYSIGNFPTLRCLEQIRNDVCYHNANVKILAVGGGFVYGNQGVTHHTTEDYAIMRVLPNMRVYAPSDKYEAISCFYDAYNYDGPAYIRLARNKEDNYHTSEEKIDISIIQCLYDAGEDINIVCTGSILGECIKLRNELSKAGYSVGVFSVPRIKPIDKSGIEGIAKKSKVIVTVEEHQIAGGLGGCCSEILSELNGEKACLIRLGLDDKFSDVTGSQEYLRRYFKLSAETMKDYIISRIKL